MRNPFVGTFNNYPNTEDAFNDLMEMLELYKITYCGIELSRRNLMDIKHQLNKYNYRLT